MVAKRIRDGRGGKAARRASQRLKRKVALEGLVCAWCGEPIDTTLDRRDPMSYTGDHPEAVGTGGSLLGQQLEPMHRRCNSLKNDNPVIDLDQWGAS